MADDVIYPRVTVGLHSQDGDLSRSFVLDSNQPTMKIGRASKSGEARLRAQPENGWVESPILSREHAAITIGRSPAVPLFVCDSGSTHGTFLEDCRLDAKSDYTLKNWDKLVFGVPVTSGRQIFQPKTFMVEFKYEENQADSIRNDGSKAATGQPNVFRVPSPSESEGDLDDDYDVETHNKREPSLQLLSAGHAPPRAPSNDVVFISQSQVSKSSGDMSKYSIDLTGVDTPELQDMQPAKSGSPPNAPRLQSVSLKPQNVERPETQEIIKESLQPSGKYAFPYVEEEDQEVNDEPPSAPDNLALIEESLEYYRTERNSQAGEAGEASRSTQPRDQVNDTLVRDSRGLRLASQPLDTDDEDEPPAEVDESSDEEADYSSDSSVAGSDSLFDENKSICDDNEASQDAEKETRTESTGNNPKNSKRQERMSLYGYGDSPDDSDFPPSADNDDDDDVDSLMDVSEFSGREPVEMELGYEFESEDEEPAIVAHATEHCGPPPMSAPNPNLDPNLSASEATAFRAPSPSDAAMKLSRPAAPFPDTRREPYYPPREEQASLDGPDTHVVGPNGPFSLSQFYFSAPTPDPLEGYYDPRQHDPLYQYPLPTPPVLAFNSPPPTVFPLSRYYINQQAMNANAGATANAQASDNLTVTSKPETKSARVNISDIVNDSPTTQPSHDNGSNLVEGADSDHCAPNLPELPLEQRKYSADAIFSSRRWNEHAGDNTEEAIPGNVVAQPSFNALKRKATEMDNIGNRTQVEPTPEISQATVAVENTQSPVITDAQTRDVTTSASELIQDSLSLGEGTGEKTSGTRMKEAGAVGKLVSALPLSAALPDRNHDRGEPALKKIKTGRLPPKSERKPRAKGRQAFKTFVSGCIAGAVTVVGAAAALIATMPASVQEEALRSM